MAKKWKLLKPKKFYKSVMEEVLFSAVYDEVVFISKQFDKTHKTWKHKPKFERSVKRDSNYIIGSYLTSGQGSKDNPYPFVHSGTKVRYAQMTPDFKAKTKVRVISSGAGRGGLMYVDKRKPRPGIKAREFSDEIKKREESKFIKRINKALIRAAKKSNHYVKQEQN